MFNIELDVLFKKCFLFGKGKKKKERKTSEKGKKKL
jgi:hypothetical protein